MTAKKKLAQKRLTLLQVAEKLRNVSEACRRHGVSRNQFYEYKTAFQEKGFEGLMDRPPIPKTFANETPPEVKKKVIELSLKRPAWQPVHVSDHLCLEEEKNGTDVDLMEEQIRLLEKANPCFREGTWKAPIRDIYCHRTPLWSAPSRA